jgi:ADP-heptose:LPS heptosyltransferase
MKTVEMDKKGGLFLLQPAFLGDVVLSTALLESWHRVFPEDPIGVVVRRGAEGLFEGHPFVERVVVWDRKGWKKYPRLLSIARGVHSVQAEQLVNLHRYGSMAWLSRWSGAQRRTAFEGSPAKGQRGVVSFPHLLGDGRHETERNHSHIQDAVGSFDPDLDCPKLHPQLQHREAASAWPSGAILLAPGSVWETKRWPSQHWSSLADVLTQRWPGRPVVLIGGGADRERLVAIADRCLRRPLVCAGDLSLLGTAAFMATAHVVVSNDSAPLHIAGAMRCSVVGVFCSTTPSFGFGVLPSALHGGWGLNTELNVESAGLDCKPCGVHGLKQCPKGHFRCGESLTVNQVVEAVEQVNSLPS